MTEDERRGLGTRRRCVFQNLANGIPAERVMVDLQLSELEVDQDRRFVARKITEWLVLKRQPPIACADVREIRWNRKRLLATLAQLGDLDLSTEIITVTRRDKAGNPQVIRGSIGKIYTQALDHAEMIDGAKHRMSQAYK